MVSLSASTKMQADAAVRGGRRDGFLQDAAHASTRLNSRRRLTVARHSTSVE